MTSQHKLVPSPPVTIHAVRHAQHWFPALYRHTDSSLLMCIQHGYDADFAPMGKWRSFDNGRTWREEEENVPRRFHEIAAYNDKLWVLKGAHFDYDKWPDGLGPLGGNLNHVWYSADREEWHELPDTPWTPRRQCFCV